MVPLLNNTQQATAEQLWAELNRAQSVLIGTHEHPDGDALGSALALWHVLRARGKQVTIYIPDAPPETFSFLPGIEVITDTKPAANTFDAIVLLDYTQLYRTGLEKEFLSHRLSIGIDHHYDNPAQGKYSLVVASAAATAQILYELCKLVEVQLDADAATCLLTGIFTDTGSFMHDSTTPAILKIASALMQKGARLSRIAHETYQKKELPALQIWGRALSRILINETTGAAVSLLTHDDFKACAATLEDLSGVVSLLNTLPHTTHAMLLCEYEPGKIKGSLRSEPHKGVDVSRLAKRLGGGGHKLAAGFEVAGHIVERQGKWRVEVL